MLKVMFKKFHESKNVEHLMMMLVVARQLFHYSLRPCMTYQQWVKTTIGEMHYKLKDPQKFNQTLEVLQQIINYENDSEIVEIHAEISIPSPRGSNHLVLEYKQLLRMRAAA